MRRQMELDRSLSEMAALADLNKVTTARLSGAQGALGALNTTADDFVNAMLTARDSPSAATIMGEKGLAAAVDLARVLNTRIAGVFVFGGDRGDTSPVADISMQAGAGASAKAAMEAAFDSHFGFGSSDPAAAAITPAQFKAFYDGPFAALFNTAGWKATWSVAGDAPLMVEIAPGRVSEGGATANQPGFARLMQAYGAAAAFAGSALNDGARAALADAARDTVSAARGSIGAAQSRLGFAEERVGNANKSLDDMQAVIARAKSDAESVDPFEAASRINTLTAALEASYAMTARLQRLSLVSYL
jgi:flagellar hook-associated protein 3 FlgL